MGAWASHATRCCCCAEPGYSKADVNAAFKDLAKDYESIADARLHQVFNDESVESFLREHMPVVGEGEREYASFVDGLFTR